MFVATVEAALEERYQNDACLVLRQGDKVAVVTSAGTRVIHPMPHVSEFAGLLETLDMLVGHVDDQEPTNKWFQE